MAYETDVIGGVPEIPDACLGDVMTDFHQQTGIINDFITRNLEMRSPLLRLGMQTRREFPAGQGDIFRKVIMTSTMPPASIGKDWTPLKAAYPGGPVPGCRTPKLIRYGHTTSAACLEKQSLRTDDFNAIDLTFKTRRDRQWNWLMNQVLPDWSYGVQKFWYREAYRRNVWNIHCGSTWRLSAQMGEFATWAKPTSVLTPDFLEEFFRFLNNFGANQTPYSGTGDGILYHVLVTGPDEFRHLDELDRQQNFALGVVYNDTVLIPGYGKLRAIRNWVIMVEDDITRLGENPDGTFFEVEATREVEVERGTESEHNPDWDNPSIAKYTVNYLWNYSATEWYTAPDFSRFPNQVAGNWNGDFTIINLRHPADPKAENAYYLADFAFGMGPAIEPRRGACVLSLAVNRTGTDVCLGQGPALVTQAPVKYVVKNFSRNAFNSQLTFEANRAIPATCPVQYAIYLITQHGYRAKVATVVSKTESATLNQYTVTLDVPALAVIRECDPWVHAACLPEYEPTTATVANDCPTCGGELPVCDYRAVLTSANVRNVRFMDGTQLNDQAGFAFPYAPAAAAALGTAITTWLSTRGGGTATATNNTGVWTVNIVGTKNCPSALVGDAGSLSFSKSNCVAAP